jgi:transposase
MFQIFSALDLTRHLLDLLRTPVRHCELNPIELIWAQVKGFVAKNNITFRLKDVTKIWAHRIFCFNIVITYII